MAAGLQMLEALTREFIDKEMFDQYFLSNALFNRLVKNKKTVSGGLTIEQPIYYAPNPDAGAWGGGFEELPMSQPNIAGRASWGWARYVVPIAYSVTDQLTNMGPEGIADMVEGIAQNALRTLKDTMGKDLYADGSNNAKGKKRLDGLMSIITHNANPAPGAYGGLTRASSTGSQSSYTNNAWWNSNPITSNNGAVTRWTGAFTISNASTQLDLVKLCQLMTIVTVDGDGPDLIVMHPSMFVRVWQLIQANEQRTDTSSDTGRSGFKYIVFNGVMITVDHNIDDAGKIYCLNTKYLSWKPHAKSDFERDKLRIPHRHRTAVSYIFWDGNLTCGLPRAQAVMTGATT
jgi:hypothetical protein